MENTQERLTQELNAALDEALELTFPASDPIAVTLVNEADHSDQDAQGRSCGARRRISVD